MFVANRNQLTAERSEVSVTPFKVGDTIPELIGELYEVDDHQADHNEALINPHGYTLLLITSETCQYCELAAPLWRVLTARDAELSTAGIRVVVVSRDNYIGARAWTTRHSLHVPLFILSPESHHDANIRIQGRLPWAFLLDSHREVVAEGHGRRAERLVAPHLTTDS
jgi:hypothetical protein